MIHANRHTHVDVRYEVLVGNLSKDSAAAIGICTPKDEIAARDLSRNACVMDALRNCLNIHAWSDASRTRRRDIDFWFSNIGRRSPRDSVEVGRVQHVLVHEQEPLDAKMRELLCDN
jgi:hypothetical protein